MSFFRTASSNSLSQSFSRSCRSSHSSLSSLNTSPARSNNNSLSVSRSQLSEQLCIVALVTLATFSFFFGASQRAGIALLWCGKPDASRDVLPFYLTDSLSSTAPRAPLLVHAKSGWQSNSTFARTRQPVQLFVGIFTTPSYISSEYGKRRTAIRETFLPLLEALPNAEFQFVVGRATDPKVTVSMAVEEEMHPGTFLHLNMIECYRCLPQKMLSFFMTVAQHYDAKWIVKMDDDVYLMPSRLMAVAEQWERIGAEYTGCMKHGELHTGNLDKWFEPTWRILAQRAHLHAYGSIYAISGNAVERVFLQNLGNLRLLGNEDMNVGLLMLAFNVTFFEDMRLCMPRCQQNAVAILRNECSGLCTPLQDMYQLHRRRTCRRELVLFPNGTFPYAPSYEGHNFDSMHAL